MRRKEEFDLEHAIGEVGAKHYDVLELPLSKRLFFLLGLTGVLIGTVIFARILALSVFYKDFYQARAEMNHARSLTLPAVRGLIFDRFGKVLAGNEPSYQAVLNASLIRREKSDLGGILEKLSAVLEIPKDDLSAMIQKADLEKSALVTLERNIPPEKAQSLKELDIPAVEINDDYRRDYLMGPAFSQVLGYTGMARLNDLVGKSGLENYYNDSLAGQDGVRLMYKNAKGEILDEKLLNAPVNGSELHTTLDADFQQYFYNRLQTALRALGRQIGVGIALNPQNGEILAMVNIPSYDNNIFTEPAESKARSGILTAPFQPLFNRAISGLYSPGSTIKPLVAVAALKEGVVSPTKEVFSKGYIEIPNPYFPDQPSRFLDWKPNGWVDVHSALARSSNIYFYAVGGGFGDVRGLGIEKLKQWWQKFGLGEKTGIDLDGESVGSLPDPAQKEALKNDVWRLGDTYNVVIGQGDILITPIELINYIQAIANGGLFYRPHLAKEIKNPNGEVTEIKPEVTQDLTDLAGQIREAQKGMEDAVMQSYGTANLLSSLAMKVAAKTGTAQISNNTKTNAFFVGYAPADNPQIAILVLVENAREGSLNVIPVAKDVLDWYYWNRLVKSP